MKSTLGSKGKLAAALGIALGFGVAGQASADVYGLSTIDIENLTVTIGGSTSGGPGAFTFSTNQDAILNGNPDISAGNFSCGGVFSVFTTCVTPVSGTVQNAPPAPGAATRGENDYTVFGQVAQYSNAEAAITSAQLLGNPVTAGRAISESNLVADAGTGAQANSLFNSNTTLNLTFGAGPGSITIAFDATIDVQAENTGPSLGIAQANSGVTILLQRDGTTVASWAPTGNNAVTTCAAGYVCTAVEAATSLNNTTSSAGALNQVAGSGNYSLEVTGLTTGTYTLAFAVTTSTDLFQLVPVPGTLLLMGTGLLLGAGATRRNKKQA